MKIIILIFLLVCFLVFASGCTESYFEGEDKKTVQTQLHVPKNIRYLYFHSYPRSWGWFGREGLRIRAEIEFTEDEFAAYVRNLDNPAVWKPVAFRSYSPSIGESYSDDALKWQKLPLPESIKSGFRENCAFRPDLIHAERGKYYCSAIVFLPALPADKGNKPQDWQRVGRACGELQSSASAIIKVLAILDYDTRRMSVNIQFSG